MATDEGTDRIVASVGDAAPDGFLYLGGIWEEGAFVGRMSSP